MEGFVECGFPLQTQFLRVYKWEGIVTSLFYISYKLQFVEFFHCPTWKLNCNLVKKLT